MRVRKLDYLIALAREGHFARAAAACHVSQPTLSSALRQLEIEMGVMIVKRGQRYSGLTEHGERVLAFAHRVAAECEHLDRELENRDGESRCTLQVGVIPSAVPWVSSLTTAFYKQYPHVNVRLMELNPPNIHRAIEEFTVDVAITYLDEKMRRLGRSHQIYIEEYSLLTRRGSALAGRKSISWDEASQVCLCLLVSDMLPPNCPIRNLLDNKTPTPNPSLIETNSITALHAYVRGGTWNAVLPRSLAAELQAIGDVQSIALPPLCNPIPVGLMIPDRELPFPPTEALFKLATADKRPVSDQRHKTNVWLNGSRNGSAQVSSVQAHAGSLSQSQGTIRRQINPPATTSRTATGRTWTG
jgi:DNA-binding transcriptional LysR family regulator